MATKDGPGKVHRARRTPPKRKPGTLGAERAGGVVDRLHGKLKARGYGMIRATEDRLKYARGYISQIKTLGDIKLSVLYELTDELGETIETLLANEEEIRPLGNCPHYLKKFSRFEGSGLKEAELAEVDRKRFLDPKKTLSDIMILQRRSSGPHDSARLLNFFSHCCRQLFRFKDALFAIDMAIDLNPSAQLYISKAGVLSSLSVFCEARKLLNKAQILAVESCDFSSLGAILTALGYLLNRKGEWDLARRQLHCSLNYSEYLVPRKLCGAYQGLAYSSSCMGDRNDAVKYLKQAMALAKKSEIPEISAKTLWLYSGFCTAEEAIQSIKLAIDQFPYFCNIDKALATVDLIGLYLNIGRHDDAVRETEKAFSLLDGLAFIPEAEAAMAQLISEGERLSSQQILSARAEIQMARARQQRAQFLIRP